MRCLSNQRRSLVRHRLATAVMQTSIAGLSIHQRRQDRPAEDSDIRARVEIWMTCCVSRYVVTLVWELGFINVINVHSICSAVRKDIMQIIVETGTYQVSVVE